MVTAEGLYQKTKTLDQKTLQDVADFVDFLLFKKNRLEQELEQEMRKYFPATEIEPPGTPPPYSGKTLTLEEMDAAVADEAGRHK